MGQNANPQRKNGTSPQISTAHKREHHGCRSNTGIRGTTKTDRPNPLGGMGSALYEPIHRQGTRNPRGGAGCMDGELRTKPLGIVTKTRDNVTDWSTSQSSINQPLKRSNQTETYPSNNQTQERTNMLQSQKQKGYKNSPQSNSRFKLWRKYILGIPLILLVSCTNAKQDTQTTQNQVENNNTSIVKVLNRVTCKDPNEYCSQGYINQIWRSCVNDGYVTELPNKQVASSRETKELTRNSSIVNIDTPKEITDENGIVYGSEKEAVTTQREDVVTGYCIGSEYITK